MVKDKKELVKKGLCTFCGGQFINKKFLEEHINKYHLNGCYDNICIQEIRIPPKRYKYLKCINCAKKIPKPNSVNPCLCCWLDYKSFTGLI